MLSRVGRMLSRRRALWPSHSHLRNRPYITDIVSFNFSSVCDSNGAAVSSEIGMNEASLEHALESSMDEPTEVPNEGDTTSTSTHVPKDTTGSDELKKPPPASKANSIRYNKLIEEAQKNSNTNKIVFLLQSAMELNVNLKWAQCMAGLTNCSRYSEKSTQLKNPKFNIIYITEYLLEQLKRLSVDANHEAYLLAMKIYRLQGDPQRAYILMQSFLEHKDIPETEQLQGEYLKALMSFGNPGIANLHMVASRRWFFAQKAGEAYYRYIELRSDTPILADRDVYVAAARAYSLLMVGRKLSATSSLLGVFDRMTREGFDPDVLTCRSVLSSALLAKNSQVTQVMTQWFVQHFDYPLEDGAISEVFSIANRNNDMVLANIALKAREKAYFMSNTKAIAPLVGSNGGTALDYASLLSIAVKSKSVTAAVEILHEADDVGVDIGVTAYGKSVLDSFTVFCSHSIALLDSLYYALVDMNKLSPDKKVPKYALTTVISAAGRIGQNDRAFATFTDYTSIFGLTHDLHSYNSLLAAMARHRYPRVIPMLQILQEMEQNGLLPDSFSFMYLIDVMTECGDMSALLKVLEMMEQRQIVVRPRSLRRAAYIAVEQNKDELLPALKKAMAPPRRLARQRHPDNLHHFFKAHLDKKIRARNESSVSSSIFGGNEKKDV